MGEIPFRTGKVRSQLTPVSAPQKTNKQQTLAPPKNICCRVCDLLFVERQKKSGCLTFTTVSLAMEGQPQHSVTCQSHYARRLRLLIPSLNISHMVWKVADEILGFFCGAKNCSAYVVWMLILHIMNSCSR